MIMKLHEEISRVKSIMGLNESQEDWVDEFGNEYKYNFDRRNFDLKKLVDSGAVFVTSWDDGGGNSIITLDNYLNAKKECETNEESGACWIIGAVENNRTTPNEEDQNNLDTTYENKIKSVIKSLNLLGVPIDEMMRD